MATTENMESPKTGATPESTNLPPPFLEVICKSTGSVRRFAAGTEAGFAANLISQSNKPSREVRIEAVKEGEEAVVFGPNSLLVNYGPSWKLQAVAVADDPKPKPKLKAQPKPKPTPTGDELASADLPISIFYIGKVFAAFIFIFLICAVFTFFLENLPLLLSFINLSSDSSSI